MLSLAIVTLSVTYTYAEGESQAAIESISQNCASIKLQLERTQKEDSRMRVHLGAQYETIATNLMQNLNVRLVRNNMTNSDLAEQQITFTAQRDIFKSDFTDYSQSLEKLVKIDCKNNPDKFYSSLKNVRAKRERVNTDVARLKEIVARHHETINQLIGDLSNGKN